MSFPRYSEYKDSGVEWWGDVPVSWSIFPAKRSFVRKKELNLGMKCENRLSLTLGGVVPRALDDLDGLQAAEFETYQLFATDDLVFKLIDLQNIKTSRVGLVPEAGIMSPAYIRIAPAIDRVFPKFAYWFFTNLYNRCIFNELGGGVRQTISSEELLLLSFPALSLPEQTQIAAFLDRETAKIDELVTEQRRLMELLKEKRQAVISHAVTRGLNPDAPMKPSGNKWLGTVPAHWIVCCLKHIKAEVKNAFVDGPFGSNLKSEHFIDDGDVYVIESNFATQGRIDTESLKTISNEHFATINRSETRGGDIVIAKIGAQYGKASILPVLDKPAVVSGNSLKLTINQTSCEVKFVNWHLANLKELGVMEDIVNATAQPALSLGEMNNLPMLVPPRAEQLSIVQFLDVKLGEFDTLTSEAQRAIDLLQERRTALISAAVTGQIDVRGAVVIPAPDAAFA